MRRLYFKPSDGFLADVIPFFWDGQFRLFYLHDYRDAAGYGEGVPWRQIVTKDLVHFEELGEMIPRGKLDEQDLFIFTGSVLHAEGRFHIFYTGHNPHFMEKGLPQEAVMHAVSDDLEHWEKCEGEMFFAPGNYEIHDWRDPFVFFNQEDGYYHMLLAARQKDGPSQICGCTAHCISSDLIHWEAIEPLWAPQLYYTHECPDLFRMGDWYYLVYSEFSYGCRTRYVKSRSINGPWESPADDVFDTRAYYAAKTASNGMHRYLFGWNPTREENCDCKHFNWGGSLVIHELVQKDDGDLQVKMPDLCKKVFTEEERIHWQTESCASAQVNSWRLGNSSGYASICSQENLPEVCLVTADIQLTDNTQSFFIRMRYDAENDFSYAFIIRPKERQAYFQYMPNPAWGSLEEYGLHQTLHILDNSLLHIDMIFNDDIVTFYLNNQIAFSARMCRGDSRRLAFCLAHGGAEIHEIKVRTMK